MDVNIPRPDDDDFTTQIDNPFMTLRPGTTFVYENQEEGSTDTVTVLRETVVIDGVTCVVVHDLEYNNGLLIEETFDWFAQDSDGNVWYFGEATKEFEPGDPNSFSTEGSWKAGEDGAEPGIVMLGDPDVGERYDQEFAPGIAEDFAKVLSLDATVHVVYGSFEDALKTKDVNPLDPSVEHKFYAAGVGNLLTTDADGEYEQLTKIIVDGTGGADKLVGYAGGDYLYGHGGNDTLQGGEGNDTIGGGTGSDRVYGGQGHDDLNGGRGDDWLKGGSGADTFIFRGLNNGNTTTDTIADYHKGQLDVIELPGGAASIAQEQFVGGVWQLTLNGDGDVIELIGVNDANNNGHIVDDLLIT